jgi:surface antigen
MAKFKQRLTQPSSDNKYYIHYTAGGYNTCIKVNKNWVLPNCVGYAQGRLLEMMGATAANWKLPACNAEDWIETAQKNGLKTGQTPKVGAVICWQKGKIRTGSDGAGHVAVVEQVKANGDIVISQSGYKKYNGAYYANFWTQTITKKSGYSFGSAYKFRGFIYCPVEFEDNANTTTNVVAQPKPVTSTTAQTFKVGDSVTFTGNTHYTSAYPSGVGKSAKSCAAKITAISKGQPHPYHVVGKNVHGWVNAADIKI